MLVDILGDYKSEKGELEMILTGTVGLLQWAYRV